MDYDVTDFLGNLFSGTVPTTAAMVVQPEAVPEPILVPEAADVLAALPFTDWVLRPDSHGRMGWEAPDLPEAVPFDDLPLPGPGCPVCGSLESWRDLLGRERCGVCERGLLDKAFQLTEKAARLREQSPTRKPAPPLPRCCVSGGIVDTLDLGGNRPLQGHPRGFVGV